MTAFMNVFAYIATVEDYMLTGNLQLLKKIKREAVWGLASLMLREAQHRPFSNPVYFKYKLHLNIQEWKEECPELEIILYNVEKDALTLLAHFQQSALVIQRAWRTALGDPYTVVCKHRLMREFEELLDS
jgi:hypothetical protein